MDVPWLVNDIILFGEDDLISKVFESILGKPV